jgi:drug/metabolite transporter (DMT)-like permease
MDTPLLGEFAALGTACCWAATAMAFESAGKRIGSLPVNLIRLVIGFCFLTALTWIVRGQPLPTDATPRAWLFLGLSGLIGFSFGDLCLFRAFVLIGSRLSILIMSLVPPIAAVLGWLVLGETLRNRELLGMALTVGGVAWVVRERIPHADGARRPPAWGVLLAIGGALGQAGGLILSKKGMAGYDAFASNQIRVLAGIAGFSVLFTALRLWPRVFEALRQPAAMSRTAFGAFFGPFLGVSLSLVAVAHAPAGVAATIMAISPVILLPATRWRSGEPVTWRASLGALVALAGTAVLFS